jgi:hypothetical protein
LRILLAGLEGRSGRYLLELSVGCVDLTVSGSAAGSERITRPDGSSPAIVPLLLDGRVSEVLLYCEAEPPAPWKFYSARLSALAEP